jgi:hypothetical protein
VTLKRRKRRAPATVFLKPLWALDVIHGSVVWIIVGVLAIVAGLQKIMSGYCKCCDKA